MPSATRHPATKPAHPEAAILQVFSAVFRGGVVTDDGIAQVLTEIRAVSAELVELRADVARATQHFGDVDALQLDVENIKAHLVRIDAFMAGPPALTERLAALERKQAEDHAEDSEGVTEAGTAGDAGHREMARGEAGELVEASEAKQAEINEMFRAGLGRVEGALFDLLHASLKTKASLLLGALVVVFILSRALGA